MKKFIFLIAVVIILSDVHGWGWDTHYFIAEKALKNLPLEEREILNRYKDEIYEGSVLPDKWRENNEDSSINHIYYPERNYGKAPHTVEKWYNKMVEDLRDKNYKEVALDAGILSHYLSDINMPLHTGNFVEEHYGYETWVNENLQNFEIDRIELTVVEDVFVFAVENSFEANKDYSTIMENFKNKNYFNLEKITEKHLSRAIYCVASVWHTAFLMGNFEEKIEFENLKKRMDELENVFEEKEFPQEINDKYIAIQNQYYEIVGLLALGEEEEVFLKIQDLNSEIMELINEINEREKNVKKFETKPLTILIIFLVAIILWKLKIR